ncbi:MAG: hypothetical protein IH782_03085 [candidate division NC10 bacterium]|nr:hypothetical protein [candidate division NC10 bacterium]
MFESLKRSFRKNQGDPIIVVSGLPRSGTSMLMKMLDAGGIEIMTDSERVADIDNPKGYFEYERVKDLEKETDKSYVREGRGKVLKVISNPTIAYILLILGMAGLYFELSTPGAILPGVLGGICLILAFYAFQTLPINFAGLLLIILGVMFFIAELYAASHGILAAGGIVALLLGSLMLIDSPAPFLQISLSAIIGVTMATAGFFFFVIAAAIRAHRRQPVTGHEGLIGQRGVVKTPLKPEGQISLRGELWKATCDETVKPGGQVEVTGISGLTLQVKKLPSEAHGKG